MALNNRKIYTHLTETAINNASEKLHKEILALPQKKRYLGFDVDTAAYPQKKHLVCVIQLATSSEVHLFDVHKFRTLPTKLHDLLMDTYISLVSYQFGTNSEISLIDSFTDICSAWEDLQHTRCVDLCPIVSLLDGVPCSLFDAAVKVLGYKIPLTMTPNSPSAAILRADSIAAYASACYDIWTYYTIGNQPPPCCRVAACVDVKPASEWLNGHLPTLTDDQLRTKLLLEYAPWQGLSPQDALNAANAAVEMYRKNHPVVILPKLPENNVVQPPPPQSQSEKSGDEPKGLDFGKMLGIIGNIVASQNAGTPPDLATLLAGINALTPKD